MLVKEFLGKGSADGKYFGEVELIKMDGLEKEKVLSFSHYEYGEVFNYDYEDDGYRDEMEVIAEEMKDMRNDEDYHDDDWQELIERKRLVEKMYKYGKMEIDYFDFDKELNVTITLVDW